MVLPVYQPFPRMGPCKYGVCVMRTPEAPAFLLESTPEAVPNTVTAVLMLRCSIEGEISVPPGSHFVVS